MLAVLLSAACSRPSPYPQQPATSPTARIAVPAPFPTFDLRRSLSYYDAQLALLVYEGLTRIDDETGRAVPGLARSWTVSGDQREYLFRLRSDARFHDGAPFTARDVVRSWCRALRDPAGTESHAWMLDPIEGTESFVGGRDSTLKGVQVMDDTTLRVRLRAPLAPFPAMLALPQAAVIAPSADARRLVGTGPWRWVRGGPGAEEIWFARAEGYWGDRPRLDSLVLRVVPDSLVTPALERGWVDFTFETVAYERVGLAARSDFGYAMSQPAGLVRIVVNLRDPVFRDLRVRKALHLVVDVAAMLQAVAGDNAVRAVGAIPPSWPGADTNRTPYAYDPERARVLLREANFPFDRTIRLWVPARDRPDFPARIGPLLREYLQLAGLNVELHRSDDIAGATNAMAQGRADLWLQAWYPDYGDPDALLYPLFSSSTAGTAGNPGAFSDPEVDRLLAAARREPDPKRREALARAADARVYAQVGNVFLWFTRVSAVYSLRLTGWRVGDFTPRFTGVRLATAAEPE